MTDQNPFVNLAEDLGIDRNLFAYLIDNAGRTPAEQIAASDHVADVLRSRGSGRGDGKPSRRVPCEICGAKGWTGPSEAESRFCRSCWGYRTIQAPDVVAAGPCPVCRGDRFIRDPESTTTNVRAMPCPECQGGAGGVSLLGREAGIPREYSRWTLARWDAVAGDDQAKGLARDLVGTLVLDPRDFARQVGRPGILFHGPVGTGKTGLAVAAALALLAEGLSVRFVVFDRLLDELRATFDADDPRRPGDVWARYLTADVLVVDDLGNRTDNAGWRTEQAYHLFDERLSRVGAQGVTLVTSNLTLDQIAAAYDSRTASRLGRLAFECPVDGADLRARDAWDA